MLLCEKFFILTKTSKYKTQYIWKWKNFSYFNRDNLLWIYNLLKRKICLSNRYDVINLNAERIEAGIFIQCQRFLGIFVFTENYIITVNWLCVNVAHSLTFFRPLSSRQVKKEERFCKTNTAHNAEFLLGISIYILISTWDRNSHEKEGINFWFRWS